jgi:hypothetical protein
MLKNTAEAANLIHSPHAALHFVLAGFGKSTQAAPCPARWVRNAGGVPRPRSCIAFDVVHVCPGNRLVDAVYPREKNGNAHPGTSSHRISSIPWCISAATIDVPAFLVQSRMASLL